VEIVTCPKILGTIILSKTIIHDIMGKMMIKPLKLSHMRTMVLEYVPTKLGHKKIWGIHVGEKIYQHHGSLAGVSEI
jgi:hypothetical protein